MALTIGRNDSLFNQNSSIFKTVGGELAFLEIEYEAALANSQGRTFRPGNSLLQVNNGFVTVDAIATQGNTAQLKTDLESLGLKNASAFGLYVSGQLPITQIDQAAALGALDFVRPAYKPWLNVGSVTSQADTAMRSKVVRQNSGFDGSGEKVGVLSDSYNNLGGVNADIASGDLPGSGNPLGNTAPVQVLSDLASGGSDEGRAMLQLVHDIVPKANLAFYTTFGGQAAFANGIVALANAGFKVIVDDVIYFAEPMFQDGIITQAVDQVVNNGSAYFSAAGNAGRRSDESEFRNSGVASPIGGSGAVLHDFDPGTGVDPFQLFTVGAAEITISRQAVATIRLASDRARIRYLQGIATISSTPSARVLAITIR